MVPFANYFMTLIFLGISKISAWRQKVAIEVFSSFKRIICKANTCTCICLLGIKLATKCPLSDPVCLMCNSNLLDLGARFQS